MIRRLDLSASLANLKFDTKLGGIPDTLEDRSRPQKHFDNSESSEINKTKINKKCRNLYLGQNHHIHKYRLGNDYLGKSVAENVLKVRDHKLNVIKTCGLV